MHPPPQAQGSAQIKDPASSPRRTPRGWSHTAVRGPHLVGLLADRQGAGDLRSAPAVHHTVVPDKVADDTESVVKGTLGLLDDLGKATLPKLTVPILILLPPPIMNLGEKLPQYWAA